MPRGPGVIALLTDFGLRDPYVGLMKGALLSVNPAARIVDLTHDLAPQDVAGAARILASAWSYFPPGTIFVAVVDPGVGTARAALGVEAEGRLFLAPDNGLLGFLNAGRSVRLERRRWFRKPVSNTFHGRDVFAPVAGHLSKGVDLDRFGPRIRSILRLKTPPPAKPGTGRIVDIDRFGNLITDLPAAALAGRPRIRIRRRLIRGATTSYGCVRPGTLIALAGSTGHLEISVSQGDARRRLGARVGDPVTVRHDP